MLGMYINVRQLRLLDQEEEVSQYIGDTRETLRCKSICIFTRNLCNIKQYKNQLRFVGYTGGGQAIHTVHRAAFCPLFVWWGLGKSLLKNQGGHRKQKL